MRVVKSADHPHVEWIELHNDGVLHECVVLKADKVGNKLMFPVNHLDDIDRKRLGSILMDRNARHMELFEVMMQKTLGNGMNALAYFHQYAKILTPGGKMIDVKSGQVGIGNMAGQVVVDPAKQAAAQEAHKPQQ